MSFFNDNILGKFYTKDFDEIEYERSLGKLTKF